LTSPSLRRFVLGYLGKAKTREGGICRASFEGRPGPAMDRIRRASFRETPGAATRAGRISIGK